MWICNDSRTAVWNEQTADLLRTDIGRFNMNMAVDKSRRRISSFGVDHFFPFVLSNSRNLISTDGNRSFCDISGEYIDNLTIFDHNIRWDSSRRCINKSF